jgi:acyl carrier protein
MINKDKYDAIFVECFAVDRQQLNEQLTYQSVPTWDSVGHMAMIAQLEDGFGIMLEMDDIIDFSSYTVGIQILSKYGVDLSTGA